ncbi:hypothetical protein KKG37_02965 [Patescibacteria group bacterium]|nr:hypothetical protein [Patescibacteria group bacterium]
MIKIKTQTTKYLLTTNYKLPTSNGFMLVLVLVFSGIFIVVLSGLIGFVLQQHNAQKVKEKQEQAFAIAEAGLEYYQWFLAHNPGDIYNGQGEGSPGPYEHDYYDPEGGATGKFSLEIDGNISCGEVSSINITSTGWTNDDPMRTKTVFGRYSRPYLTEFAYITDENIWFGVGEDVVGRMHSNGGIRMDGLNDSLETSEKETWICPGYLGCSGNPTMPGVFGNGAGWPLWRFPDNNINFLGMVTDFSDMKAQAISNNTYLPPSLDYLPNAKGYKLIFLADGTIDVYIVINTKKLGSYYLNTIDQHWYYRELDHLVKNQNGYTPKPGIVLDPGCSLVFVEDRIWVEGEVNGKITLISAEIGGGPTEIIIPNNITYVHNDGTDGLLLMSQGNITIPWYSPYNMELNGIFIAQGGRFGRDYYWQPEAGPVKGTLTLFGSIINAHTGTNAYVDENSVVVSGYQQSINTYDRNLLTSPPPMMPYSSTQHRLIEWREGAPE